MNEMLHLSNFAYLLSVLNGCEFIAVMKWNVETIQWFPFQEFIPPTFSF